MKRRGFLAMLGMTPIVAVVPGAAAALMKPESGLIIDGPIRADRLYGELIVDGQITAHKIAAGSITAEKICVNTISARELKFADFATI